MTEEVLLHYSAKPLGPLVSKKQIDLRFLYDKPKGLWVSVRGKDDWENWCRGESFGDIDKQRCYRVSLTDDANILRIRTADELDSFSQKYGMDLGHGLQRNGIDWARVAKEYQGIIIAPYIWSRRLNGPSSDWYYGWDCASGCIWDVSAIAGVTINYQTEELENVR